LRGLPIEGLADERFDLIVSNPPYIAASDPHLVDGDVRFEPSSALVAGVDGLDDLRVIAAQAPSHLTPGGWLLLEHGYDQADAVQVLLRENGFVEVGSRIDLGGHQRITVGRLPC
jgi:release factor glutamine methyltransferase